MLNRVLWAVLVLLLGAITVPKVLSQKVDVIDAPLGGNMIGATVCNGEDPIIIVRAGLNPLLRSGVLEHERVHARQIKRFGSCTKFYQKFQEDGDFRFTMELEAYCPDLRKRASTFNRDALVNNFLTFIKPITQPVMDDAELKAKIYFCLL